MSGRVRGRPGPEAPRRSWALVAVAIAGVVVAGYLTTTKLAGGAALFCTAGGGCGVVQASRYALFLGIPTAGWGVGLFGAVAVLAFLGLTLRRWLVAFLLAVMAVSFSAYLTYVELFVISAVCGYCVVSAGISAALFGVLLGRRPAGPRRLTRPGRVAALGSVTAVATVAIAAAIFALAGPREAAGFQEGLARHLADTGAMMYGAFW